MIPIYVDNSMRKDLVLCQKKAYWHYERHLQPVEGNVNFVAGRAFAKGIEVARKCFFEQGMNAEFAVREGISAAAEEYGAFKPPVSSKKTPMRVCGAVMAYFLKWPLQSETLKPLTLDGKAMVEVAKSFEIPVVHPVTKKNLQYCGPFDLLALRDGRVWVVDDKLTNQLGDSWALQWDLDSQMTGYCYLAAMALQAANLDLEVGGAIVRGTSVLKDSYGHVEVETRRMQWELERWREMMEDDFEDWVKASVSGKYRMALDHACAMYNSPCEFAGLCKAHDPERMIEGNFDVKEWLPMSRV